MKQRPENEFGFHHCEGHNIVSFSENSIFEMEIRWATKDSTRASVYTL